MTSGRAVALALTAHILAGCATSSTSAHPDRRRDATTAEPGLTIKQVTDVAQVHGHDWGGCYETWLPTHPGHSGDVDLSFIIAPDGRVDAVAISGSTFDDHAISDCLVATVRRWRFPSADRPTEVDRFPFRFLTKDDSDVGSGDGLSRKVIQDVISQHLDAVKSCYETALATHPELTGDTDLSFVITRDGRVERLKVLRSTSVDSTISDCVADAMRRISFPHATSETAVNFYPFLFRPKPAAIVRAPARSE